MISFFCISYTQTQIRGKKNQFEFLIDKENDIELKTAALQKQLENEKTKQVKLCSEMNQLQTQLQEAKNGLMAAARLSDQLELNQLTIDKLNNESKFFKTLFMFLYLLLLSNLVCLCALLYLTSCEKERLFSNFFSYIFIIHSSFDYLIFLLPTINKIVFIHHSSRLMITHSSRNVLFIIYKRLYSKIPQVHLNA